MDSAGHDGSCEGSLTKYCDARVGLAGLGNLDAWRPARSDATGTAVWRSTSSRADRRPAP